MFGYIKDYFYYKKKLAEENRFLSAALYQSRRDCERLTIDNGDIYKFYGDNIRTWEQIRELVNAEVFNKLVRFMALEIEEIEQNIIKGDEHRFWFCQGSKHILFQLLKFSEIAKKRIEALSGILPKDRTDNQSGDLSYES